MPVDEQYRRQAELMMRVMPHVARETCFALKGGTAINFFIRDLPRLSVDIDLAYLPVSGWTESLQGIDVALRRIAEIVRADLPRAQINYNMVRGEDTACGLYVHQNVQVKVEVTPVMRGCVYEPQQRAVTDRVQEQFGFASMQVLSFADVYAGKLAAAHDRQHPRDLFDVRGLLENEGVSHQMRTAFIIYLITQGRPVHKLLAPEFKDISDEFNTAFTGMTEEPASLEVLLETRERMIAETVGAMPENHKKFLRAFLTGEPDWPLLGAPGAEALPAVRWRMQHLDSLNSARRREEVERLEAVFRF
ncbi:MAG: nucleotidyl transferase AbiEii/AbiGii toxin family protein [Rhodospirillales bacterium]